MRMSSRSRSLPVLALLAGLVCSGCYDPPVKEAVLLTFEQDGRVDVQADTIFKLWNDMKPAEREEVQRILDLYDLGRDPWMRGFERAGATGISHECLADAGNPRGISRKATLPSVEAIVLAMPDAIANIRLLHEERTGIETLRIVHIDWPESLRENWRRIEKELDAFARVGYRFSEAHCDLYEYLSAHRERRHDLLQALKDEEHIEGVLTPGETVLAARLSATFEELTEFGQQTNPPIMAGISFAPFDHDFCLRLPPGAEMVDAGGFLLKENEEALSTWCAPRLTLADLIDAAWPQAEPGLLEEGLQEDAERLATAPFTCVRHADQKSFEDLLRERILPRSRYEIAWKRQD